MVHIWYGNQHKYEWTVMIDVFRKRPKTLKCIEFFIGDIKVNDFEFRQRDKHRIYICYMSITAIQERKKKKRELIYHEIKHWRNYVREIDLAFFRFKQFLKKALNNKSAERKRWYKSWRISYMTFFEKHVMRLSSITWANFFLLVIEFTRACLRFCLYFFIIHQIMTTQRVQEYLYYTYGDEFLHSHIYCFFILQLFPLHAMYRYHMRENYHLRPIARIIAFIKYYSRISFCFIRYRLRLIYLFLRKTDAIWRIEDAVLDKKLKNCFTKCYRFIYAFLDSVKSKVRRWLGKF